MKQFIKVLISFILIFTYSTVFANSDVSRNFAIEEHNRSLVINFYDRFFNKHEISASELVADNYIQHNPYVSDGKLPFVLYFKDFFKQNPYSQAKIIRSATDGDLVYLHVHATNGLEDRGQAVLDIFRVKDGMIVEHWDVIQEIPQISSNRNTMF